MTWVTLMVFREVTNSEESQLGELKLSKDEVMGNIKGPGNMVLD